MPVRGRASSQPQHLGGLELLAQHRNADAQLLAQLAQGRHTLGIAVMVPGGQVIEKFGGLCGHGVMVINLMKLINLIIQTIELYHISTFRDIF